MVILQYQEIISQQNSKIKNGQAYHFWSTWDGLTIVWATGVTKQDWLSTSLEKQMTVTSVHIFMQSTFELRLSTRCQETVWISCIIVSPPSHRLLLCLESPVASIEVLFKQRPMHLQAECMYLSVHWGLSHTEALCYLFEPASPGGFLTIQHSMLCKWLQQWGQTEQNRKLTEEKK